MPNAPPIVLDSARARGHRGPRRRRHRACRQRVQGRDPRRAGTARTARRRSRAAISWSRPAAAQCGRPRPRRRRASSTARRASSSTSGLRTTNRRVYAIGDVTGGPHSPMRPAITPASSCATRCSACRAGRPTSLIPRVDLHRSGAGPCRPDGRRGAGRRAGSHLRAALALSARTTGPRPSAQPAATSRSSPTARAGSSAPPSWARRRRTDRPWSLAIAPGAQYPGHCRYVVPYPTLAEIGKRAAITYLLPEV